MRSDASEAVYVETYRGVNRKVYDSVREDVYDFTDEGAFEDVHKSVDRLSTFWYRVIAFVDPQEADFRSLSEGL